MRRLSAVLVAASIGASLVPCALLIGLALHRHITPGTAVMFSAVVAFAPLTMATLAHSDRPARNAAMQLGWSLILFFSLPTWFPGERLDALQTALSSIAGEPVEVASVLPTEDNLGVAHLQTAEKQPPPSKPILPDNGELVLPFEGDGRRLSLPVVFVHGEQELEVDMMLDTGATYTTLTEEVLNKLGISLSPSDPEITLHTANGTRKAKLVLIDSVWLGDLLIENVVIAVCDVCQSSGNAGLLGLNVTGTFSTQIRPDDQTVLLQPLNSPPRTLDIQPFTDLNADFTRFPGGRVQVDVHLKNHTGKLISSATASIECDGETYTVPLKDIEANGETTKKAKLPKHRACSRYMIRLKEARW